MALIGLILASIVNLFIEARRSLLNQLRRRRDLRRPDRLRHPEIRRIGEQVDADSQQGRGLAIRGALTLYSTSSPFLSRSLLAIAEGVRRRIGWADKSSRASARRGSRGLCPAGCRRRPAHRCGDLLGVEGVRPTKIATRRS